MKLTESQLKQVIAEEIQQMVDEGFMDRLKARAKGGWAGVKGKAKAAAVGGIGKVAGWADDEAGEKIAGQAAQLKKQAGTAGAAAKLGSIVDSRTQELVNDLEKLGIKPGGDVLRAINLLKKTVAASAQ